MHHILNIVNIHIINYINGDLIKISIIVYVLDWSIVYPIMKLAGNRYGLRNNRPPTIFFPPKRRRGKGE